MYTLAYFNTEVQDGVQGWPDRLRARYFALVLRMADHGPDLGMPHTRALAGGLCEIRAKSSEGIGRAFYCTLVGRRIVILHEFIKKSQKTPKRELRIARNRMKEIKT